jgi:hypothetical protein
MLRLGEELHKCRLARRFSALLNARLNSVLAPCVQTCCPWPWPVRCVSVPSREKGTPTKGQLSLTLRAPQSSGEQWRRAPVRDEQGGRGRRRTRGGRYLRHRPPPGSLTAVGSNSGRSRPDSSQLKVVEAEARGAPVQCLVAVFRLTPTGDLFDPLDLKWAEKQVCRPPTADRNTRSKNRAAPGATQK